jgi:hypothetical protein
MKWSRVPPSRCITIAADVAAPESAIAFTVRSSLPAASEARNDGAISTPASIRHRYELAHGPQPLERCAVPGSSRRQPSSSTVGTLRKRGTRLVH